MSGADGVVCAVVVGSGRRGRIYSRFALEHPDRLRIVAYCDPSASRRAAFAREHPGARPIDASYEALTREDVDGASLALVCTPDREHEGAVVRLAGFGLHILCEKPMGVTREGCRRIARACSEAGVMLAVCHVMRYTPANRLVHSLIAGGAVGQVVNVQLLEPVGFAHFAHSYVRGNWRSAAESSFALLAKSCHDLDILRWWARAAGASRAVRVESLGGLVHFTRDRKPAAAGAATRCMDCAHEPDCAYSARRIYLDAVRRDGPTARFCDVLTDEVPDVENIAEALRVGPYGACVYECPNDVADNQTVTMRFDNGLLCTFLMTAFTEAVCQRETRVFGSRGEIRATGSDRVEVFDFVTRETTDHSASLERPPAGTRLTGHGGADWFMMDAVVRAVARGDPSLISTGPADALASHELVFRAEEYRLAERPAS